MEEGNTIDFWLEFNCISLNILPMVIFFFFFKPWEAMSQKYTIFLKRRFTISLLRGQSKRYKFEDEYE